MSIEKKLTPQERYAAKYKKQIKIDCFTSTEQDILSKLESVPNKAGYIKSLIRKDIALSSNKDIYPIVLTPEEKGYTVYIPDFDINTQGDDLTEALYMARDVISLMCKDFESDGKTIPPPSIISDLSLIPRNILAFVDINS